MTSTLLIRADAGPGFNSGRAVRCLAFAERWAQAGGKVVCVSADPADWLQQQWSQPGFQLIPLATRPGSADDAGEVRSIASETGASTVLLDGSHFDEAYQQAIHGNGLRTVVIDEDGSLPRYDADALVSPNPDATAERYRSKAGSARLLLGQRFVLLRRGFLKWRDWQRPIPERARKILVTLGNHDRYHVAQRILRALHHLPTRDFEVTIVTGAGNPHRAEMEISAAQCGFPLYVLGGAVNLADRMAEADLAVAAGGVTAWELAFMGVPALLVNLAVHHATNTRFLELAGTAQSLGWHTQLAPGPLAEKMAALMNSPRDRSLMSQLGRRLIDGDGATRLWLNLHEETIRWQHATLDDARTLWQWTVGLPEHAAALSDGPSAWNDYEPWLRVKLRDRHTHLWIWRDAHRQPVGTVRFDPCSDREVVLSVTVDPRHRRRNLGSLLVWAACRRLFQLTPVNGVFAYVKAGNLAAGRALMKAGFERLVATNVYGQFAMSFGLTRQQMDALRGQASPESAPLAG